ncbi:MAG: DNA replication/repair protein RecF [Acidiferrobacterales bacterium]
MPLTRLEIQNFRLLEKVVIEPGAKLNILSGCNAAGKTTLLEAIYVLATGRSFRTRRWVELIRHGTEGFVAHAAVTDGSRAHRVGLALDGRGRTIRVDGSAIKKVASLAQHMPLLAITPELHFEFLRSSRYRRSLLDWWLFHVEPDFYPRWLRYQRLLGQRNAALRHPSPPAVQGLWDEDLAALGEDIDRSRQKFFLLLREEFLRTAGTLLRHGSVRLTFLRGWDERESLLVQLRRTRLTDQRRGYTQPGPHHADLRLEVVTDGISGQLSHGQQKILVIALRLAQLRLFMDQTGRQCILLADDIGAELDAGHRQRVCDTLETLGAQIFLTALDPHDYCPRQELPYMFHVEQGRIEPVPRVGSLMKKSDRPHAEMLK